MSTLDQFHEKLEFTNISEYFYDIDYVYFFDVSVQAYYDNVNNIDIDKNLEELDDVDSDRH